MKRLLLVVLASLAFATPAHASYNHVSACKASLRGVRSDDDIHRLGLIVHATSFGGWGAWWHNSKGEAFVTGRFNYGQGGAWWYIGHCSGGDYRKDSF